MIPEDRKSSSQIFESSSDARITSKFPDTQDLMPRLEDSDLSQRQETTRSQLAKFLLKTFAGTLVASLVLIIALIILMFFVDEQKVALFEKTNLLALVKDLIALILTAQTGLLGSALGYYFGSKE